MLKFFPAEAAGGVKFLKAVCAPYSHVKFIPTGGIDTNNIGQYLAIPQVLACGGSWMIKPEWMKAGEFDRIGQAAREAVALVSELRAANS
jgi:2-dehydro-3-deoxyphosphogluconate aldolase / (4S)-4-hydroxy-2-oxoglutarate aldolase